jgi:hypothetical protein
LESRLSDGNCWTKRSICSTRRRVSPIDIGSQSSLTISKKC